MNHHRHHDREHATGQSKIRKEPAIGSKYYKQCLFVAFAIKRRTFEDAPWFREANLDAQSYQQQNILRDQQAVAIRRDPFLRQVKSDLVNLKKANKNADALLDFLRKTYGSPKSPPRDADASNKKKHLFEVMKKFDPRHCSDEMGQFGPHIFTTKKVLYEEITKMLTHHYETNFKGGV